MFDNLELVLSDDYRCPIPTGIGKIDETLEGGLGKGELGIVLGPSSFGKTSLTTAMASHAATYKCDKTIIKALKSYKLYLRIGRNKFNVNTLVELLMLKRKIYQNQTLKNKF